MSSSEPKEKPASLSSIRSGLMLRGLALAKLSLGASSRMASHNVKTWLSGGDPGGEKLHAVLMTQAKILADELGQLKGSVMKVGQMLSMYGEHFLPPEVNMVLKSLQFQSPPLEWKAIEVVIKNEIGEKRDLLEIDPEPLACASLGQVHRARIKATGQWIALKVQYPGVDRAIESDLRALKAIFKMAQSMPQIPHLDQLFDEVKEMLYQEVDYRLELKATQLYREKFADDSRVMIPEVFPELSSQRVLATGLLVGDTIDSRKVMNLSLERRNRLARVALEVYFRELFEFGIVQTDPHLGNYRIRINDETGEDQLVMYDFGALRAYSPEFVAAYKELVNASVLGDRQKLQAAAKKLSFTADEDPEELKKIFADFCFMMVEPFTSATAEYDFRGSDLPRRLTSKVGDVISSFKLRAPPREVVFLDRKTGGVFIFLSVLGAKMNASDLLRKYTS